MFLLIGMHDHKGLGTTALADFSGEGVLGPSAGQEKVELSLRELPEEDTL